MIIKNNLYSDIISMEETSFKGKKHKRSISDDEEDNVNENSLDNKDIKVDIETEEEENDNDISETIDNWINVESFNTKDELSPFIQSGPINISSQSPFSYELFQLFFTKDIIDLFTKETNRYVIQSSKNSITFTSAQIKAYIGILLLMGIHKMNNVEDHWSRDPLLKTSLSSIMAFNVYKSINQFFHLHNNEEDFSS